MRAAAIGFALLAGCGTTSTEAFLLDTEDCALSNNVEIDDAATPWTDCRVFWSGLPYQTLTVELTIPNTTGSFLMPGAGWLRASFHVPGELDAELGTIPFARPDQLPTNVAEDKLALDLPNPDCGNLGSTPFGVRVMADVGDRSVSLSMTMTATCTYPSGQHRVSGGFIVTAAGKASSPTNVDVGTVVTPAE